MPKHAALVVSLLLLFAGVGSAAVVTRPLASSHRVAAAIQHEKNLGPKPTPRWYWRWSQWRLGEGYARGHARESDLRPKQAPTRIPHWAWGRLHFFLLARSERALAAAGHHGGHKGGTTTTTTSVTTTTTGTTTTPTPSAGVGPGIGLLNYGGHLTSFTHDSLYGMVVGDAWDSDATVLASVPGLGLAYFAGTDVNTNFSTGVPYAQASANGWLLKDSSGNLLVNKNYPSNYIGDIGDSAYQRAFITNIENYLAARPGIDGIFIDDTVYDPKGLTGTYPAKYPSTAAWSAAMLSFVKAVYAALHGKGYYLALNADGYIPGDANSNSSTNTQTWWKEIGPYTDGLMNEYYDETSNGTDQRRATGTAWYQQFDSWQQLIGLAQGMGDDFLGLMKGSATDTTQMTYGKASFLLEWNGGGSIFMYTGGATDPTNSAWTADIGSPAAPKVQVGVGWQRVYTGGTVLVNPSTSVSQTFTVDATSYTLGPTTARILVNP